ncbi:MAG TPA: Sua5/YciO/YrdC/YwlC family protein, partial [Dehalococcoidia bacterium]|nr:Sua5/YciO/YrdC/YwlC family protein [Dehalococcoidia bacterium]
MEVPNSVLERAVELLKKGEVVAFPTDTVYGVGAHSLLPE